MYNDATWPPQVLLVQRKDSFGYLACVDNGNLGHGQIADTLATITESEKDKLLNWDWDALWLDAGCEHTRSKHYKDQCRARFEWMGIRDSLAMMDKQGERWQAGTEWGIPKGRMASCDNERPLRCALRELEEETGIQRQYLTIIKKQVYEESYVGTDGRTYNMTYYLAHLTTPMEATVLPDGLEVSQTRWATLEECEECLRSTAYDVIEQALEFVANLSLTVGDRSP